MDYLGIKAIHVGAVTASYALFVLRGIWMIRAPRRLDERWVKIIPHAVDTVLLASAIVMVVMSRQYPFVAHWLTAKVIALVLYIALGMVALRQGRTRAVRIMAWVGAQCVFLYIVAVALTRQALPF